MRENKNRGRGGVRTDDHIREAFKKKNCVFCDIGPKGGWVPVSKHNFF